MERTKRLETVGIFALCFAIFLLGIGSMAEDFLKSRNSKLQTAGQEWIKQNEKPAK